MIYTGPDETDQWCGVMHLHSTYSDGQLDMARIIETAREVDLDFIVMTDHRTMQAKYDGYEGLFGSCAVCIGYEHNDTNNNNHYLVLGASRVIPTQSPPQAYIDEAAREGALGFIAHPWERRNYFKAFRPYPWNDWSVSGFDGIEIWNQMSNWLEHVRRWYSFVRILFPRRFNTGAPVPLIALWDALNRRRFVGAVGGVDFHTRSFHFGSMSYSFFPVKVALKSIRTHIYVRPEQRGGVFDMRRKNLYERLRNGSAFISNYRRGDARGSIFLLESADGMWYTPGKHAQRCVLPARFHVWIPGAATVVLVRNGVAVAMKRGKHVRFDIHMRGVYRIEVRKRRYTWMYTNPFPVGAYPIA
jgi:hypothetical protein